MLRWWPKNSHARPFAAGGVKIGQPLFVAFMGGCCSMGKGDDDGSGVGGDTKS